jgi:hypothetical protein
MKNSFASRILAHAGELVRSKSSVLVPLHWKLLILGLLLVIMVLLHASVWIEICLVVLLCLVTLQSSYAYNHFMKTNPDALRSEKFATTKYAIDKGLYGDSDSGTRPLIEIEEELLIPQASLSSAIFLASTTDAEEKI